MDLGIDDQHGEPSRGTAYLNAAQSLRLISR
jgi:hypothetical protein